MTYPEHSHTGSVTLSERLARISLFRWRLEWGFLVMIAVSIVLGEQAREQRAADPYLIIQGGRSATATVRAGRVAAHTVSPRWMRTRQEMRTLLDLEWLDRDGNRRTVENYHLDFETIVALRIDPSTGSWPTRHRFDDDRGPATRILSAGLRAVAALPRCGTRARRQNAGRTRRQSRRCSRTMGAAVPVARVGGVLVPARAAAHGHHRQQAKFGMRALHPCPLTSTAQDLET